MNTVSAQRKTLRLKEYDYASAGAYFVTICAQDRRCIFGAISGGQMLLNPAGIMIEKWWHELRNKYPHVTTDCFTVMPNHFHGIITVGADLRVCPDAPKAGEHAGSPLPGIVQWFKTMTTNEYIRHVKANQWPQFSGKLWQRNYYEHVVRNEHDLNGIREYIINNPAQWDLDTENPEENKPVGADLRVCPEAQKTGEHAGSPLRNRSTKKMTKPWI